MLPTPMPLTPGCRGDNPRVPLPFVPPSPRPSVSLAQHLADRNDPHRTMQILNTALDGYVTSGRFVPGTCRIELLHGETVLSSIDASPFVKDGMVSSVTVSDGKLVIEWNSDSGAAGPTEIPLTDIFNPSNYYDKASADNKFVEKEPGKRLMTDVEGTKLSGIETGAQKNVKPDWNAAAGSSAEILNKPPIPAVADVAANTSAISVIEGKIPSQATAQNQLADKAFVNSSIATNTAFYISDNGLPFQSLADLETYEGVLTNNDYAFVVGQDSAGNTTYTRYKWNEATETWGEEYVLNNSSFTAAQWAAISSGITSGLVAKLGALPTAEELAAAANATSAALALRPTKAQLDEGWWSEWKLHPDGMSFVKGLAWSENDPEYGTGWCPIDEDGHRVGASKGNLDSDDIAWEDGEAAEPFTATRHRVAAPVPTKASDIGAQAALTFDTTPTAGSSNSVTSGGIKTALDGKASVASTVLIPHYAGDWIVDIALTAEQKASLLESSQGVGEDASANDYAITFSGSSTMYVGTYNAADVLIAEDGGKLTFHEGDPALGLSSGDQVAHKAVDYYILGTQTDKHIGVPLTAAQLSNIAAIPNKADASALRYDLGAATVITTASEDDSGEETIYYGAATLADRTGNIVQVTASIDELRIAFPAAVSGKLRDFGLRVEIGTGSAALAAPALVPIGPITLENKAAEIPALADGTATAKGTTLLYFSETAPGIFVVKGEQVEEVA